MNEPSKTFKRVVTDQDAETAREKICRMAFILIDGQYAAETTSSQEG